MAAISTISAHNSAAVLFLLLLLTPFPVFPIEGAELPVYTVARDASNATQYLPTASIDYRPVDGIVAEAGGGGGRRVLAPFQLCLLCRCCDAGDPANCTSMRCCFGIDCGLPNKPYGVCAFVPKTCDCTSCA